MNPKISKEQIIAYLYGELSEEEAQRVATYLQDHPEEAAEYESMQQLRGSLQKISDVEVTQPVIMLGQHRREHPFSGLFRNRFFRSVTTAAAVVLIGLLMARITGLSLTYRDRALMIAFDKGDAPAPAMIAEKPTQELKTRSIDYDSARQQLITAVNEFIAEENRVLSQRLASLESNFQDLKKNTQSPAAVSVPEFAGIKEQDMEDLARKISRQNLQLFSQVIKASQVQQEEYIKSLFSEFAVYFQSQRVEDLKKIEASLHSLRQESDLKKLETDETIARIIQTVNDKDY